MPTTHANDLICIQDQWDFIEITGSTRLYFRPAVEGEKLGFHVKLLDWQGGEEGEDMWSGNNEYNLLYHGVANRTGLCNNYFEDAERQFGGWYAMPAAIMTQIGLSLEFLEETFCADRVMDEYDTEQQFMAIKLKWG